MRERDGIFKMLLICYLVYKNQITCYYCCAWCGPITFSSFNPTQQMNWDLTNWKSILLNFLRGESGDELSWRYPYLKGIKGMIQILVGIDKLSNVGSALDKMPIKSTRIGSHPLEKQKQIVWSLPFFIFRDNSKKE